MSGPGDCFRNGTLANCGAERRNRTIDTMYMRGFAERQDTADKTSARYKVPSQLSVLVSVSPLNHSLVTGHHIPGGMPPTSS